MPVTSRHGRKITQEPIPQEMDAGTTQSTPWTSPWRPSPYHLLSYLLLLALGSLYAAISPAALPISDPAPLAPGIASDANTPLSPAPVNYFAGKRNLLNLYFVKIGWFWTTLAFILLLITSGSTSKNAAPKAPSRYLQAIFRYTLITLSWLFTTQWFFGPGLVDRSFRITGGHCEAKTPSPDPLITNQSPVDFSTLSSSIACKSAGGHWRGGHDISGHIFMLVLSSAFLLLELYLADRHSEHPSVSPRAAASLAHDMTEEERKSIGGWESESVARVRVWARYFVWIVVGLDVWMILMTAIWFHTWPEKLSGLILSVGTIWVVYWLPDFVPQWRAVVGGL